MGRVLHTPRDVFLSILTVMVMMSAHHTGLGFELSAGPTMPFLSTSTFVIDSRFENYTDTKKAGAIEDATFFNAYSTRGAHSAWVLVSLEMPWGEECPKC